MEVNDREVLHNSIGLVWTRLVCGQSAPSKVLRFEISYFVVAEKSQTSCDSGKYKHRCKLSCPVYDQHINTAYYSVNTRNG